MLASLQRSGSRCIPTTSADGYFRYIVESIVNADFTEAKRKRQDAKKVLHSDCCKYMLYGKCREAFLSCFKLCELGVISVLVNTIPDT